MHNLDSAVLSRFDLKLKFDFLNPFQIAELAQQQAKMLGLPELTAKEITQLQKISNLTLGDFAAIFRQHQFTSFETVQDWQNALAKECALKPSTQRAHFGFL